MLNVVILAAGLGKRMQSDLPKVLHTLAGKPMLAHVLDSARQLDPARIVVVIGHGAERVREAFQGEPGLAFAVQQPQQGTGHAVQQAVPALLEGDGADDATLVLYGDVPLVQPDTLRKLLAARGQGMAVLTETLTDPTGYGRIVRGNDGQVQRIVEHKDASDAERAIDEVNTGILCAPTANLKQWLARIDNNNAQGEYYLTDVVALSVADGVPVGAAQPAAGWETLGVNSRVQQAELERRWQHEQARRQLEAGVTLADPARFDVRVTCLSMWAAFSKVTSPWRTACVLARTACCAMSRSAVALTSRRSVTCMMRGSIATRVSAPMRACDPARIWAPKPMWATSSRSKRRGWAKAARPIIWLIWAMPRSARA
jgi:bifunctional UDP-N-acetylglucosamine pyrophosphorylase/glucosamine-1-phosphate N-acetyltransferase